MNLAVRKFNNDHFGSLSALKSEKTGKVMFIAKEVCDLWGHTNSRQAIKDAKLMGGETLVLKRINNKEFFEFVCKQNLLSNKTNSIQLVSESGLYKLALNSKKQEADQLKHWLANDVLPSIRENGKYVIESDIKTISDHSIVSVQKKNSKDINSVNFKNGGVALIKEYNIKSCEYISGKKPKEIKDLGKQLGLKSSTCQSAKEVLRQTRPELACTMSFVDNAVKQGQDFDKFLEIGKKLAAPLFKAMLDTGMKPGELSM